MALMKQQQELIGVYGGIPEVRTPYWNLFEKGNAPYLSKTEIIRIDEILTKMQKANIVPRGVKAPPIKVNGHNTLMIEPDIIAASLGIKASDDTEAGAGETIVIKGQQISSKKYNDIEKVETIKVSIENTKEEMAASAFLTGKCKDANGDDVDLGLEEVKDVKKGKDNWTSVLRELIEKYKKTTGKYPDKIFVGSKIASEISKEIEASPNAFLTQKVKLENGVIKYEIGNFPMAIETFPETDIDVEIGTRVHMYKENYLAAAFAGLEYVGTSGKPEMIKADVIVDKTEPDRETAQGKIFGKSAPFPIIVLPKYFARYNFTDIK